MNNLFTLVNEQSKKELAATTGKIGIETYYNFYFSRLLELTISRFNYEDLPEHIPVDAIEKILIYNGSAIFTNDTGEGLQVWGSSAMGSLDMYGRPTSLRRYSVFGMTTDSKTYKLDEDCVFVRNNTLANSDLLTIQMYAKRLSELVNTIDINMRGQKTNQIIATTARNKKSMETMHDNQQNEGVQVLYLNPDNVKDLSVFSTPAQYVADRVRSEFENVWAEALTTLGVNNVNFQKKERLLVDEVNANNEEINRALITRYNMRKQAMDKINDKWGFDIKVKIKENDLIDENKVVNNEVNNFTERDDEDELQ